MMKGRFALSSWLNINVKDQNEYFRDHWQPNINKYRYSGYRLISQIDQGESVIDIGCGYNPFKGKIQNLIGIDPANDAADVKCSLEDFQTTEKFDVAFCLGSINFGNLERVKNQIKIIDGLLKPKARIYWRCNPGHYDHKSEKCRVLTFFPWSIDYHIKLSVEFGFTLRYITDDDNDRIYAEWIRGY